MSEGDYRSEVERLEMALEALRSAKRRSQQPEVRNPVQALPSFAKLARLPRPVREALRGILGELAADARTRADKSWAEHKAPMAVYWKGVAVYAGHTRRVISK